ncbi:MAG: tetratricopeptide repeat protein, partial [Jiangellaceae bacterium]
MNPFLARGREAFDGRSWRVAFESLAKADGAAPLDAEDLERWATAAHLVGDEASEIWERAQDAWVAAGEPARAARCAFWLGFGLANRGEAARGGGWLHRAQQLVDDAGPVGAAQGLLIVPQAMGCLETGDPEGALAMFSEVLELGDRFGDHDLCALGRLGRGQALVGQGDRAAGLALLDEVIVVVTAEDVSPMVAGLVFCAAIETCQRTFDLGRAREWTQALTSWCDAQPDLVPYRGQCLVHRAEVLQLHGAWSAAADELRRACERLAGVPAVGDAWYRRAEMHRLRGQSSEAEDAYRAATRAGREPQPGLALLRLAQGRTSTAAASIRRVVDEARTGVDRAGVLGPYVEIAIAAGELTEAREAADELSALAGEMDAGYLRAVAAQ